MANKLISGRP